MAPLRKHSVLYAAQSIPHALGADIGIKQAQRRRATRRSIRRFESIDCGGRVVKDSASAADDPSQTQVRGVFTRFAIRHGSVASGTNGSASLLARYVTTSTRLAELRRTSEATMVALGNYLALSKREA